MLLKTFDSISLSYLNCLSSASHQQNYGIHTVFGKSFEISYRNIWNFIFQEYFKLNPPLKYFLHVKAFVDLSCLTRTI